MVYVIHMVFWLCSGAKEILQRISEKQGMKMNSLESAKDIPKFIDFFKV